MNIATEGGKKKVAESKLQRPKINYIVLFTMQIADLVACDNLPVGEISSIKLRISGR